MVLRTNGRGGCARHNQFLAAPFLLSLCSFGFFGFLRPGAGLYRGKRQLLLVPAYVLGPHWDHPHSPPGLTASINMH
jgi:hypothetical protein